MKSIIGKLSKIQTFQLISWSGGIHVEEAYTNRQEAKPNAQGLEHLMNIVGIMIPQTERGLSQYEHILHVLEVLLDALDNFTMNSYHI